MKYIKLTKTPEQYKNILDLQKNFYILDYLYSHPVIALFGERIVLAPDDGWMFEYEYSDQ